MKYISIIFKSSALVLSVFLILACSDKAADTGGTGDHVWKTQTESLEKAQQVDQILQDATAEHKQAIEEQTK